MDKKRDIAFVLYVLIGLVVTLVVFHVTSFYVTGGFSAILAATLFAAYVAGRGVTEITDVIFREK